MADVHYNLGILLQNQRLYSAAIKSFKRAIYFRPSMALAYVNLGESLMADGLRRQARSERAREPRVCGSGTGENTTLQECPPSYNLQRYILNEATGIKRCQRTKQILPDTNTPIVGWTRHSVISMVGEIYVQLQQWPLDKHSLLLALAASPHHAGTHVTLAQILARNASRSMEAEMWFKKALTLAPNDPSVRDQFGCRVSFQSWGYSTPEREREVCGGGDFLSPSASTTTKRRNHHYKPKESLSTYEQTTQNMTYPQASCKTIHQIEEIEC